MTVTYDVFEINTPITKISYDNSYGYYVSSNDVKDLVNNYIKASEYDHIFVAYKLGDYLHEEHIKTGDWIGLGGMTYENDIGFSNIRVPNENSTLLYKYSTYNSFPEEVFVHEFLHGLERIEGEYGKNVIELHSNLKYGYQEDEKKGLKEWYKDYLQSKVTSNGLGLSKEVFKRKPVHNSDFIETVDLTNENFYEPQDLREEILVFFNRLKTYFTLNNNEIQNKDLEENSGSIRV